MSIPLVGVGGISTADDAVQYMLAGASLVQIGTASFADPGTAERVIRGMRGCGRTLGIDRIETLIGEARLPASPAPAPLAEPAVEPEEAPWPK